MTTFTRLIGVTIALLAANSTASAAFFDTGYSSATFQTAPQQYAGTVQQFPQSGQFAMPSPSPVSGASFFSAAFSPTPMQPASQVSQGGFFTGSMPAISGSMPILQSPSSYKSVLTTTFWVGEPEGPSNDYIQNSDSAWDTMWLEHYGGVDDPHDRCGYLPCAFTPNENPFYFALPYNDLNENGTRKASALSIPGYAANQSRGSVLKNSWIEIRYQDRTCYAQWEDVGPNEEDDFAYVFGNAAPRNTFGERAGLDVSPAVSDCLGMLTNAVTSWRFVPASSVPSGPWRQIVTTSDVSW